MIDKSKLGAFCNPCFTGARSRAAKPNQHVFASSGCVKEYLFGATVEAEVRSNFSFMQEWSSFWACVGPISRQGLLKLFYSIFLSPTIYYV